MLSAFLMPGEAEDDLRHELQDRKAFLLRVMLGIVMQDTANALGQWRLREADVPTWAAAGPVDSDSEAFRRPFCLICMQLPYDFHAMLCRVEREREIAWEDLRGFHAGRLTFLHCDALALCYAWEQSIAQQAAIIPQVSAFLVRVLGGNQLGIPASLGALVEQSIQHANRAAEIAEGLIAENPVRLYDGQEYVSV